MIGLLARRTLTDRPRRTLMLLAGFGLSVGVMIVLLSIGEAVLDQARDKDLVGGDLVLLPEGIDVEVMKVGGATGMFFGIDNARFVYRQVLSGPRYAASLAPVAAPRWPGEPDAPPLAAASPLLGNKLVYVRKAGSAGAPRRALAHGIIPSLDAAVVGPPVDAHGTPIRWQDNHADRMWMDPPADSLYNDMDRFHVPAAGQRDLDRWAEWLYFNFTDPANHVYGFLSLIAAGDVADGRGRAAPLLQLVRSGETPARFPGDLPLARSDFSTERVDLHFGPDTAAWFAGGAWHLRLGWQSRRGPVRGLLVVRPVPDLYDPPFVIHASERFVSGYVVPAIRAQASGWIEAGGRRLELHDVPAYHDHNWGTWRDVHWDWGTAATLDYGLFYGRVEHPELRPGRAGAGVFCMLSQARRPGERGGFLQLFRPDSIAYAWDLRPPRLPGTPTRVPSGIRIDAAVDEAGEDAGDAAAVGSQSAAGVTGGRAAEGAVAAPPAAGDHIAVRVAVEDVVATPPAARSPQGGGEPRVFLQVRGPYTIAARIAGRQVAFTAPGFSEVFVREGESTTAGP